MSLFILAAHELRMLWRHGFAVAYLVVTALYAAVLAILPPGWASAALPVLAWSDPTFFCFFFAGASVCLDLAQGTFDALFVTPLRPATYFAVKAASLSVLAFLMAVALSAATLGAGFDPIPLAAAALAGGLPSAAIGAALALKLGTVNRFMIGSMPAMLALSLPVLRYALPGSIPGWLSALSRLAPSDGALELAKAAYAPVPAARLGLSVLSAAAWTAAASLLLTAPAAARARGR